MRTSDIYNLDTIRIQCTNELWESGENRPWEVCVSNSLTEVSLS